jgi:hypothetical protein
VITAAITAAVAGLLALFGVKLSTFQLAGIAIGVKLALIIGSVLLGARVMRRRNAKAAVTSASADADASAAQGPSAPGSPHG